MADPLWMQGTPVTQESVQQPAWKSGTPVEATPQADNWQPTEYGFKVKPETITFNDLNELKFGLSFSKQGLLDRAPKKTVQTVRREDGALWFGPEQGNKGKPGWFDEQGHRLGDAPGANPGLMDRLRNFGLDNSVSAASGVMAGNMGFGPYPTPGNIVKEARRIGNTLAPGLVGKEQSDVESILPNSTNAGVAKGFSNVVVAPAQLASRLAGGSRTIDSTANAIDNYYRNNFDQSKSGEILGEALPFFLTAGASEAAQVPGAISKGAKALQYAKGVLKGAGAGAILAPALTPETNIQNEADYWNRKKEEASRGAAFGTLLGAVPAPAMWLGRKVFGKAKQLGETPAPGELLDELGGRLGGKTPGQALQDSANAKYSEAWDEFSKAVAPVDAEAGGQSMNYSKAISKLEEVLGVGKKRAPMSMPDERRKTLTNLLGELKDAGKPDGEIDNSFQGAIGIIQRLGAEQRRLARVHGDTEARLMLNDVRDAVLQSMEESNPSLSESARQARSVFAEKVVPLFDKSQGGQFLTQIRDTPTPGDLLVSGNQGSLNRIKPGKAAIIAKGSSADPILYSYLETAINQSEGKKPGMFAYSLKKAMPAIEEIADAKTAEAFKGLVKVAETARWTGTAANLGAAAAMPGHSALGAGVAVAAHFNPAYTGPGLIWRLLQAPGTRKLLTAAAKMKPGSADLELVGRDLYRYVVPATTNMTTVPQAMPGPSLPQAAKNQEPEQ